MRIGPLTLHNANNFGAGFASLCPSEITYS